MKRGLLGVSVDVLRNEFPGMGAKIRRRSGLISQQSAQRIKTGFQERAHVITGKYRDSAEVVKTGDFTHLVQVGSADRDYWDAFAEEYGTRYRPPHPALTPAAEAERPRFLDAMDRIIDNLI